MSSIRKQDGTRQRVRDPEDPYRKFKFPFSQFAPRTLASLHYHSALSDRLKALANDDNFPHMLFYGPSGAGKKTRIACTLRELFGQGAEKRRNVQRVFVSHTNHKYEVAIVQSNFHFEMNCGGAADTAVIQQLMKDIAETQAVNATRRFKVLVLHEAGLLSQVAQSALRRSMETYANNLRIILCTESIGRIIDPIKSRCLLTRVAAPTPEEMHSALQYVSRCAGFALPEDSTNVIIETSGRNMRQAILILEMMRMKGRGPFKISEIDLPDWKIACHEIGNMILADQTPKSVANIRRRIYELLSRCIPAAVIFKDVAEYLVGIVDESIRSDIVHWTAVYELRTHVGRKDIYHLEAWVIKIMRVYQHFLCGVPMDDNYQIRSLAALD
ncbi:P-loop containing nucleoside triphosphate hydrolase protein [Hymenopellis radicata]|nr:P-loop containing nucleoside triphosphate hydrolase protein [Hymenopellis radicata]